MKAKLPLTYSEFTESDLRALTILIAQRSLVGPGHFGSLLWPNSVARFRGNCSASLARSAGKVLNRLRSANCAEWISCSMTGTWGWRATEVGKHLHAEQSKRSKTRVQCAKCPWKKTANPHDIPGGYSEAKHRALEETIANGGIDLGTLRLMACHESTPGRELSCVGWLVHQLGVGNNLALRLAVIRGRIDGNVRTVGEQHERFEDTLPKRRRKHAER